MSDSPDPTAEFYGRFEALLAEARQAGVLGELMPRLTQLLQVSRAKGATVDLDGGEPVPRRFGMVGLSPPMLELFDLIERVAPSNVPVLIQGETGTGKELVARALHDHSPRKHKLFLAENCGAVSPNLLESELFGHTRGSFTGAVSDRDGHFTAANGGTVFLDEIGDMPLAMQTKLLRVLQDGEVRPVGSDKVLHTDVRVLGASNKDLQAMCSEGTFRQDLYFRLNVITLRLPPLRERGGDVRLLVRHLLTSLAEELGRAVPRLTPEALAALEAWRWPGNVRELENELRRALALGGEILDLADLSPNLSAGV